MDFRLLQLPHLARSEVLKMVDEEQRQSGRKLSTSLDDTESITGERGRERGRERSRRQVRTEEEALVVSGLKELATKTFCEPLQVTWPPPSHNKKRSTFFSRESSTSPGKSDRDHSGCFDPGRKILNLPPPFIPCHLATVAGKHGTWRRVRLVRQSTISVDDVAEWSSPLVTDDWRISILTKCLIQFEFVVLQVSLKFSFDEIAKKKLVIS